MKISFVELANYYPIKIAKWLENAFRRFESVYRPENRTDGKPSVQKCIYKILKNFRVEKMKHSLREYEAQACGLYEAAALLP